MKRVLIAACVIVTMLAACEKDNVPVAGNFEGSFQRNHGPVADVEFAISNDRWEGHSSITNYPALCKGSYRVTADTIRFYNECYFTADFDHSLILDGPYTLTRFTENSLEFHRSYADGREDKYRLQRK